ncbi:MAG: CsgG/HfaB family protein [Elusimicrobiota bacterium]
MFLKTVKCLLVSVLFLVLSVFVYSADTDSMVQDALKKIGPTLKSIPDNVKRVGVNAIKTDKKSKINADSLQDQIVTLLLESERFQVIDREALNTLLTEQKLQLSGAVGTNELVQAGKLIGVQGFFFGSVEEKGDKVILNLKLVDVESSALIYSKTFTGESSSYGRLGIGLYAGGAVDHALEKITICRVDRGESKASSNSLGLSFSYKQGFQSTKLFQLGIDLGMAKYTKGGVYESKGYVYDIYSPNPTADYTVNIRYAPIFEANIMAKLFLSSKVLFGTKTDLINPYFGVSFKATGYSIDAGGAIWGRGNSNWITEGKNDVFISICPIFGVEANFTKHLSFFVNGIIAPEATETRAFYKIPLNESTFTIPAGIYWSGGLKYYFNLF